MKNKIILIFFIINGACFAQSGTGDILSGIDTDIKNPLEMRDPFKKEVRKQSVLSKGQKGQGDNFSNIQQIGEVSLEKIRIVGVLLGGERRALAKIVGIDGTIDSNSNDATYTIKEGMILGQNKGVVKAILPGGIVVVEEITNVYDKKEYLETVIPISSF